MTLIANARSLSVFAPCRRGCCSRGFSLLELLVVIAIILILATLIGLNSGGISGAAGVTSGAELVHNQINAARQTASAKDLTSFVVVRTTGPNAWQRVGVFALAPGETQWQQVDRWRNLPIQCFVDPNYSPATEPWSRKPLSLQDAHQKVLAPSTPIPDIGAALIHGDDYLAMAFLPDGSLVSDDNVALRVAAGRSDNGTVSIQGGLVPTNWVKLVIEKISGQVKEITP
jgi:prepilin-type N-terminal cleavage/methylation domain-containing protein